MKTLIMMSVTRRVECLSPPQVAPGEALTKEELQSGVDVANEVAESYTKSTQRGGGFCCRASSL